MKQEQKIIYCCRWKWLRLSNSLLANTGKAFTWHIARKKTKSEGGEIAFIALYWQTKNVWSSSLFCYIHQTMWIRIHLRWFGPPGPRSVLGMRIQNRIQEQGYWQKCTNKPDFQPFKKALYLRRHVVWPIYLHKLRFLCKNSTFSDGKIWPRSGSALVCLPESGSALRWTAGSRFALKSMRIHNTWEKRSLPYICQRLFCSR